MKNNYISLLTHTEYHKFLSIYTGKFTNFVLSEADEIVRHLEKRNTIYRSETKQDQAPNWCQNCRSVTVKSCNTEMPHIYIIPTCNHSLFIDTLGEY